MFLQCQVFQIFFFILFVLMSLLIAFQNLLFKKIYFISERSQALSTPPRFWLSTKIYWCIMLRGVWTEQFSWRLIYTSFKHIILTLFFCVYWKRIFKNQHVLSFISFIFMFFWRWINSNKFELILLHKNMKTK